MGFCILLSIFVILILLIFVLILILVVTIRIVVTHSHWTVEQNIQILVFFCWHTLIKLSVYIL